MPTCQSRNSGNGTTFNLLEPGLEHRLLLYTAVTGITIACVPLAKAEVVFTSSNVLVGSKLEIDLDHDGTVDFRFSITKYSTGTYAGWDRLAVRGAGLSDLVAEAGFLHAAALRRTARIESGSGKSFFRTCNMATGGTYFISGEWANTKNRYVGVKFVINGEVHYGWLGFRSVTTEFSKVTATLAGWAYETEPNKAIVAGDMGGAAASSGFVNSTSLGLLAAGHTGIDERRQRAAP
jgi:hypothetical protein